jgi:hypothetical protein
MRPVSYGFAGWGGELSGCRASALAEGADISIELLRAVLAGIGGQLLGVGALCLCRRCVCAGAVFEESAVQARRMEKYVS